MTHKWAILDTYLRAVLARVAAGQKAADVAASAPASANRVAVIPVRGMLMTRSGSWLEDYGLTSSHETIGGWIDRAVADQSVSAIVLDVDSPGGMHAGTMELAAKVRAASETKKVYAVANPMAASAAYWIASAASRVYVTPSGEVGSIGVRWSHWDESAALEKAGIKITSVAAGKYKLEGDPALPLDDEARAEMQRVVDADYAEFVGQVARFRGTDRKTVESDFGQGRMVDAKTAVKVGMADRIGTLETALADLAARSQIAAARRKAAARDLQFREDLLKTE